MFNFFKKKPKKKTREQISAEAHENARKAREEIGDENIQKMAEALRKIEDMEQGSAGKQARDRIRQMDKGKVADNLKIMMEEEKF